MNNLILP